MSTTNPLTPARIAELRGLCRRLDGPHSHVTLAAAGCALPECLDEIERLTRDLSEARQEVEELKKESAEVDRLLARNAMLQAEVERLTKSLDAAKNRVAMVKADRDEWVLKLLPANRLLAACRSLHRRWKDSQKSLAMTGPLEYLRLRSELAEFSEHEAQTHEQIRECWTSLGQPDNAMRELPAAISALRSDRDRLKEALTKAANDLESAYRTIATVRDGEWGAPSISQHARLNEGAMFAGLAARIARAALAASESKEPKP